MDYLYPRLISSFSTDDDFEAFSTSVHVSRAARLNVVVGSDSEDIVARHPRRRESSL